MSSFDSSWHLDLMGKAPASMRTKSTTEHPYAEADAKALAFVEAEIGPIARQYAVKPHHWIQGWDESFSFCHEHATEKLMQLQAAAFFGLSKADPDSFMLGGGRKTEEDEERFCKSCKAPLDVAFNDYACGELLNEWDEFAFDISSPRDCWCLENVLTALSFDGKDEDSIRLRKLVKRIAVITQLRKKYRYPEAACDEADFLKAVANHKMEILRDDGIYRHIKFKNPQTFNQWFALTTWPGHLCISGDMGTFVFTRLADMFEFFRSSSKDVDAVRINPQYWAEKCVSRDRDGVKKFSPEYFKARITEWLEDSRASAATIEEAEREVIFSADDGEYDALTAARDFEAEDGFQFRDFWECDCRVYTYSFLWACYAIAWGIQQYDIAKSTQERESNQ